MCDVTVLVLTVQHYLYCYSIIIFATQFNNASVYFILINKICIMHVVSVR